MSNSITSTSTAYVRPPAWVQSTPSTAVSGASDPDGDGDQHVQRSGGRHHGGGGHVAQAMAQALQSIMPAASQSTSTTDSSTAASSADPKTVVSDVRSFLHSMFQAIKGAAAASGTTPIDPTSASSGNATAAPNTSLANKLSSLISQVSAGNVPSDLQASFDKLMSDMGGAGSGSATSSAPTLQSLLTAFQGNLGYSAAGNSASTSASTGSSLGVA